jgi:hypothetical protein
MNGHDRPLHLQFLLLKIEDDYHIQTILVRKLLVAVNDDEYFASGVLYTLLTRRAGNMDFPPSWSFGG